MKPPRFFTTCSEIFGLTVLAGGLAVLAGWMFDISILKSLGPSFVSMKANTALCFAFIGLSLCLLQDKHRSNGAARRMAQVCSGVVLLVGLLTLTEYLSGWNFGIDQLLFQEPINAILTSSPGRMAINTSFNFILIGIVLLLLSTESPWILNLAQVLVIPVILLSLLALLGYLYEVNPVLIGLRFSTAMALHTSILFLMTVLGCLFARPGHGLMKLVSSDEYGGLVLRRSLPVVIVLPPILGWLKVLAEKTDWFDHEFGVSLVAIGNASIVSVLVYILAMHLNRLDAKRRKIEENLTDSEKKYRMLFDSAGDAIFIHDADERMLAVNQVTCRQYGYTEPELMSLQIHQVDTPEEAIHTPDRIARLMEQGWIHFETVHRRKDGSIVPVEVNARKISWNGQPAMMSICRDVSLRKQMEDRLAKINTCFLEQGNDHGQNINHFVALCGELLGGTCALYSRVEGTVLCSLGQWNTPADFNPTDKADGHLCFDVIRQDSDEVIVIKDLGSSRYTTSDPNVARYGLQTYLGKAVRCGGTPVGSLCVVYQRDFSPSDDDQRILGIIASAIEVEEERHMTYEQMENAKQQAEAANIAKSQFLANMSHEIRTPMNSILGFSELLSNEPLAPEHAKFVQTIHDSGESLLTLINDILDFSKIEAKKLDLEILDFDLRDLLEDFAGMMAVRAQEKGLEFLCSANPDVPSYVQGDPGRLRQILTNLTGNAFKFTEKGEVAVRVTVVSKNDTEAMLRFSVRDTGIGIPADKLDRLFKSFSQVDSSTTRQYGGTGLGLIISKQLSEMMGGKIGVSSEKGKGSEFWFTARLSQQPQRDRTRTIPAQIKGIRILVVDNNASNREILTMRLASWGAVVAESPDGPSALETMQKSKTANTPFDVVITNMQMPGMDGLMLGRAIRQEEGLCQPRLILMTSLGQQNNTPEFAQIGFAACLTKPVRPSELYARLTAALIGTPHTEVSHPVAGQDSVCPIRNGMIRILLADDSTINQIVTTKMLEQLGYRSDAVANGQEAITSLCTLPYDLVLMDCQMPEMDGYEATRAIRGGSSGVPNPQVPIIAITANAMQGDREKCLEAGMSDYLSKPVQLHGLAAMLERWLPQEADAPKDCPAGTVMEPTATALAEK